MEALTQLTPAQLAYERYLEQQWQVAVAQFSNEPALPFKELLIRSGVIELGDLTTHPDDHLSDGSAIEEASTLDITTHEYMLSKGRKSTKNFRAESEPEFDILGGDRQYEGIYAAEALGINIDSLVIDDEPDGEIWYQRHLIVPKLSDWIVKNNIDLLLVMGTNDHPDHIATKHIGMFTAAKLYAQGYNVNVAEVVGDHNGNFVAPASEGSIQRIIKAAIEHKSQMRVAESAAHPDWIQVSRTMSMHPNDYKEMKPYPFFRNAYYRYHKTGSATVMTALDLAT